MMVLFVKAIARFLLDDCWRGEKSLKCLGDWGGGPERVVGAALFGWRIMGGLRSSKIFYRALCRPSSRSGRR